MLPLLLAAVLAQDFSAPPPPPATEPSAGLALPARDGSGPKVGGVIAPATLPAGATALYALLGAPDIGGGYRQGFSAFEFEARLLFNYLLAAGVLEAAIKLPLYEHGKVQMAPVVAVGLEADSGSRYYDKANFSYFAIRPRLGFVTAYRFSDTVAGLLTVELPWAIPVSSSGGHVTPSVSAGAEVHLGGTISGLVMGEVGLDAIKMPLGTTQYRALWGIKLGLGFRLF